MQFVIIGLDGTDKDAPSRRQAVRQHHIAMGDKLLFVEMRLWLKTGQIRLKLIVLKS